MVNQFEVLKVGAVGQPLDLRSNPAPPFEGGDWRGQELLPKYIEQDAKQGPSSQFAERAGSGL